MSTLRILVWTAAIAAGAAMITGLASCATQRPSTGPFAEAPYVPTQPTASRFFADTARVALAQPFKGITTDGKIEPNLYRIEQTGVSTAPIRVAADALAGSLSPEQRTKLKFPIDSNEWRTWHNIHRYPREGVSIAEMTLSQREKAFALLNATLSARGYATAVDVMKLNQTIAELTGKFDEYGESRYWFTLMGEPSATAPWGWQLDGHHLIINTFVLGDQIVMTPTFMGSEPVVATGGRYAGTRVFDAEQAAGLALMRALTLEQQRKATIATTLPREVFTAAFRDNIELKYAGLRHDEMTAPQQALLLALIETYTSNVRPGHAKIRLEEVRKHLASTYFAWIGGSGDEAVFYYRVHSPVILIEFDHQSPVALPGNQPTRDHVHTVVRTPNGNDYGRDLLRQHHERHDHSKGGHTHPVPAVP